LLNDSRQAGLAFYHGFPYKNEIRPHTRSFCAKGAKKRISANSRPRFVVEQSVFLLNVARLGLLSGLWPLHKKSKRVKHENKRSAAPACAALQAAWPPKTGGGALPLKFLTNITIRQKRSKSAVLGRKTLETWRFRVFDGFLK
jgi:hypothetical protein